VGGGRWYSLHGSSQRSNGYDAPHLVSEFRWKGEGGQVFITVAYFTEVTEPNPMVPVDVFARAAGECEVHVFNNKSKPIR